MQATTMVKQAHAPLRLQRICYLRDDPSYRLVGRAFARRRITQIYKASDRGAGGRIVAIKRVGLAYTTSEGFLLEVQLMQMLNQHDQDLPIPTVLRWFGSARAWYLVMDFVEGPTLEAALRKRGRPLPVEEVLQIGISLCDTLAVLHTYPRPILHRDIKPANIIRSLDGRVVLTDFGTACFADTPPGAQFRGTWVYAAPEQKRGQQVGPAADIYALGASLYELLTGHLPRGEDLRKAAQDEAFARLPPALQHLLHQMLERDPRRRPASMQAVKAALQRALLECGEEPLAGRTT
jgi:eukaryotic-like serine/threonine-protein kinase